MKRAALISVCVLAAAAVLFGFLAGLPVLRRAIETYRHVQQAALREPAARAAWAREFGDPARLLSAFPKQPDNSEAVHLIELVHPLGVSMARPRPERRGLVEAAGDRALSAAFADYGRSELTKIEGSVEPPPETVRALLETCQDDIDAIAGFLSTSRAIVWESDVSLGPEAPVPNLLGHVQLQRVLIAEALNRARQGHRHEAEDILEASWALNRPLRDRPDVISQLIAVAAARMEMGLVRRIPVDPVFWRARLVEHDYRESLLRAIELESIGTLARLPASTSLWDRATRADFLNLRRAFLIAMRGAPVSDGPIGELLPREEREPIPGSLGAILESSATPNLAMAMRRVDRLIVDSELSGLVLKARLLKGRLGHWPQALPETEGSRVPGGRWNYAVDRDGRMTISFSRELNWGNERGIVLPLRYATVP